MHPETLDRFSLLYTVEKASVTLFVSSGTDAIRAKREPSLCNELLNGHFWSNMCLNCIFKWT